MEINKKEYNLLQTKKEIKQSKLLLFLNGTNKKSNKWLIIEQGIKFSGFYNRKISNNITKNLFNHSIYKKTYPLINGVTFLAKPIESLYCFKKNIIFEHFCFTLIGLKLNNKIYPIKLAKNLKTIEYKENFLLLHQFLCTSLKKNFNSK